MTAKIAVVRGDGIGPEVTQYAIDLLNAVAELFGHEFAYEELTAGGAAIDALGTPLPEGTVGRALRCDALLLGAVGGPKWEELPGELRPERALLGLRAGLGLFANIRPARLHRSLLESSPLRADIAARGIDFVIVRELTGGLYFGKREKSREYAYDTMEYTAAEIERVGRVAFELARKRNGRLCSVDKANVLDSSRLWRETLHALRGRYPDVEYEDMFVDNAAAQLLLTPERFDVIVTENTFGDILSDEAASMTGSLGMLPSASMGTGKFGMYEPAHGSAPDIAGKGIANPVAAIESAAMMLEYTFGLSKEAAAVRTAVSRALTYGYRTPDIASPGERTVSGGEMTAEIIKRL